MVFNHLPWSLSDPTVSHSVLSSEVLRTNQLAVRNRRASSQRAPTNCTPIGRSFDPCSSGRDTAGVPRRVHSVQKIGVPVVSRPRGASPVAAGVRMASYFSNIFSNFKNKKFKLIDPRGKWGSDMYGDLKYDVAKLRHSIVGGFDTITNGLYSTSLSGNNQITVKIFEPKNYQEICAHLDNLIKSKWNLNEIKLIEGLLFISMLPLHRDHFERQLAFYSIGIQRLNEVLDVTNR